MKRQAMAYEQQIDTLKQQMNQVNERERLRVEAIKARVGAFDKIDWKMVTAQSELQNLSKTFRMNH